MSRELVLERLFFLVDVCLKTRRIDERILCVFAWLYLGESRILLVQIIEAAVRREEHVDMHLPQRCEAAHIVVGDRRIILVVHQNVSGIPPDAAKDDNVVSLRALLRLQGPRCASLGMAGG